MMVAGKISNIALTRFTPEDVHSILLPVFRYACLGGLETNPGPVTPEIVAALFDHLIALTRAAQNDITPPINTITNQEGASHA